MYGRGGDVLGSATTGTTGVAATVAGITILPNTGGNVALTALSVATIAAGVLVTFSFVATRVVTRFYR